jgi:hypothetical protein
MVNSLISKQQWHGSDGDNRKQQQIDNHRGQRHKGKGQTE